MTSWSDMEYEGYRVPLDLDTADRLLAGAVAPEDAPPGYAGVARMLEAATAEPTADVLEREVETVALIAATVRSFPRTEPSTPRRSFMPFALSRLRLTAALVAAGLACSAGLASAGALPGAAQEVASEMLAKVGISVPGPNEHAGDHPSVRGKSAEEHAGRGKGSEISELATTTELTGVEKGAAISTVASNGKSQAGQHGQSEAKHGATVGAPVETPSGGGMSTADTASDAKSSSGTATANEASNGASAAGSGNASNGQETADEASGGHSSAGQSRRP
jgi:hypothetical protein